MLRSLYPPSQERHLLGERHQQDSRTRPAVIDNQPPAYWRLRAEEAKVVADHLADPSCRRAMYQIAGAYEQMARVARRFQMSNAVPVRSQRSSAENSRLQQE